MFWEVQCNTKHHHARKNKKIYANFCQNSPKICKIVHKQAPFSPIKRLFCLKNRSKSTFQPMKVCSKWVYLEGSWVDTECFYALLWRDLDDFWTVFGAFFFTPFHHLEPVWSQKRVRMTQNGPKKWAKNGPKIGHFRVILDHFWVDPGHFGGHLGIILASFWHPFGSFWRRFELIFPPFWCIFDRFFWAAFFRPKTGHFGWFWVKKMHWNRKTLFWRGHLGLLIREGTRSNGHEQLEMRPVVGAQKAILHRDRNLVSLVSPLNRHFTKIKLYVNCVCLVVP